MLYFIHKINSLMLSCDRIWFICVLSTQKLNHPFPEKKTKPPLLLVPYLKSLYRLVSKAISHTYNSSVVNSWAIYNSTGFLSNSIKIPWFKMKMNRLIFNISNLVCFIYIFSRLYIKFYHTILTLFFLLQETENLV